MENLEKLARDFGVFDTANYVLGDPRFPLWTGSGFPNRHHYGKGGLMQHTLEVAEISLTCNNYFSSISKGEDPKQLLLAAIFHDSGKMWDYRPVDDTYDNWEYTEHRLLIHHISRSASIWNEAAKATGISQEFRDAVFHAILAHHGHRNWGSPVEPKTGVAWILHNSDCMSARVDDYKRISKGE